MIKLRFNIKKVNDIYGIVLVDLKIRNTSIKTLVDTGASVPVRCAGVDELKSYFPDCEKQDELFLLNGFGKKSEFVQVYKIPDFVLSDGKQQIHFKNLSIAVTDRDYSFQLIISYSMLSKVNIGINSYSQRGEMRQIQPYLSINSARDTYYIGNKYIELSQLERDALKKEYNITCKIIDCIYSFVQA